MERLLHYVWKYKLYSNIELITIQGKPITVLDPGCYNTDAGPDFFNAKIKMDNTVWVGNIEIHTKASDWILHKHDEDKAYDSVILHVVEKSDTTVNRANGNEIPQLQLIIPNNIQLNYSYLLSRDRCIDCLDRLSEIADFELSSWMTSLLSERLERKTNDIFNLLEQSKNDWNEAFYIILARSFGVGINSDAFELLAKSLPSRILQKHGSNSLQIEALFFGQAGLLDEKKSEPYYQSLQKEYLFLKHKFELKSISGSLYKTMRIRPANFPHIKLAQLAALWIKYDTLFSIILENNNLETLRNIFKVAPSPYWETHYHFNCSSSKKDKIIGNSALNIVLINTVVPIIFAYGTKYDREDLKSKALSILESIPVEDNSIVSAFVNAGCKAEHAGDSQALIQLKRMYCEQKKCLYCRIGFRLLSK